MSELETRLAELRVEWPPEPDVAGRVRARLESAPQPRRRWRQAWAVALAILVLGAGVAAVPPARSAVLRWLGIEGVRIERVPVSPTPAPSAGARPRRTPAGYADAMLHVRRALAGPTRCTPSASG